MNAIQLMVDALSLGSQYALVALGIGLIFGVMRMINFAQGDLIMLGAYALVVPTTADVAPPLIGKLPALALSSRSSPSLPELVFSPSDLPFARCVVAKQTVQRS